MNTVQILGNLTRDPQVRMTKTGKAVASFSVAVNRKIATPDGAEKEAADYINVTAWGTLAEAAGNELRKGSRVFVEGRYSTRTYEAQDGTKKYMTEVVANCIAKPLQTKQAERNPHAFDRFGEPPQRQYAQGSFGEDIPF